MADRTTLLQLCLVMSTSITTTGCSPVEETPPRVGQYPYSHRQGSTTTNYLLFIPDDYDHNSKDGFPFLVFLHGVSTRGDNIEQLSELKKDGPPMIVEHQPDFPCVVMSPQCPSDSFWSAELDRLGILLEHVITRYAVDQNRIYLTGLSMGGTAPGIGHCVNQHASQPSYL